mgnify:CR=1 FL=1
MESPREFRELHNSAIQKFESGEFEQSIELFETAVRNKTVDAKLFFNYALALGKLGEIDQALDKLHNSLKINPIDGDSLKLLKILVAIWKKRNFSIRIGAELEWAREFLKDKDFFANYAELPFFKLILSEYFQKEKIPHYNSLEVTKSKTIAVKSKMKNKFILFEKLFYIEANWPSYAFLVLPSLSKLKFYELKSFIEEDYPALPENEQSYALVWLFGKGKKLYEQADYEESSRLFESLVKVEPVNLAVLFHCGKSLRDSGDLKLIEKSTLYFKKILKLNFQNPLAWHDLSISYAILGDFRKELFCLERAYEFGYSKEILERLVYLQQITAPINPFDG